MTVCDIKSGVKEGWHIDQLALYILGEPDPRIRFEEEGHRYFDEVGELPSVTKIVNPEPNAFYRPGSAQRGHSVHKMCILDAQGILDESTVAPGWLVYLAAWRLFRKEMMPTFLALEQIVGHPGLRFAGRRDLLLSLPGENKYPLDGMVLYLKKTGKYATMQLNGLALARSVNEAKKKVLDYHAERNLEVW